MVGGLIHIATYGSQDIFLTGTPEITFFKIVYRRHTNFSIESVKVEFDDPVGFGKISTITIPRIGDLMYKTYLEVILPEINLQRLYPNFRLKSQVKIAENNFNIVTKFMNINRRAYVAAYEILIAENNNDITKIINIINDIFNDSNIIDIINNFKNLMNNTKNSPFTFREVSLGEVVNKFSNININKNEIFKAIEIAIDKSTKLQNFFFTIYRDLKNQLNEESDKNIKFAWVERVGHSIIKEIELDIGGQKIDKQYGDWINIWYELTANRNMEEVYFQMIGNVEELTNFDRKPKPSYKLRIPLQFWYCRYNGLALPLVALEYHEVTFKVIFRKIEEVSYIEKDEMIKLSDQNDGITLDEVPEQLGIDIDASMLIDYIYLDNQERKRFAQSSHEYLIDQLQVLELKNITVEELQIVLNNFVHPIKELIWVAQKERYTINLDGYTPTRFHNYSLTDTNKGNIISFSQIIFHNYNRIQKLDGNYFNYVQPYETHHTTPSDGINIYSFSIFPEEFQPSGSTNMSRLSRVTLLLEFDKRLIKTTNEPLIVRIYARNLNILRFTNGLAGLAFTYG